MKRLLLLTVFAAFLSVPVAASAATPTVTVNPASPVATQSYTISGCGYQAAVPMLVVVSDIWDNVQSQNATSTSSGCFATTWIAKEFPSGIGPIPYHVDVYLIRKNGKSLLWQAGLEFSIVPL